MAEKVLKEHLYGDLLSPTPDYHTDFAMGMTYSLSFEALLTAHLAFGMLGDVDENVMQSPHVLLEAITKNSDNVVVFCNKGGIAVPPTSRKMFSLMEDNIFEVFDDKVHKANFHPKLWLIREINKYNDDDVLLKLIVTSRNLAYTDTIDCIVCLTGKVKKNSRVNKKHIPLVQFVKEVIRYSNIKEKQEQCINELLKDLQHVERFEVDAPFDDYDFFPYLFNKDFGLGEVKDYLVGTESIVVSPFIDKPMLDILCPDNTSYRTLITRKEYVTPYIFGKFKDKGGIYVALDDLASRGMDLHAKMYHVWKNRDEQYLYLGSANATGTAFGRNGEFLIRLKYAHGNSQAYLFLSDFYEKDNPGSKFKPQKEACQNAVSLGVWDKAESAMKELMCSDIKSKIVHHQAGDYSIIITSSLKKLDKDVYIVPLQYKDKEKKKLWTGRVVFDNVPVDELSEFFILSTKYDDGTKHEAVIKIYTEGMPKDRDKEIYKNIIKTKKDFFKLLELMLSDTPLEYLSRELLYRSDDDCDKDNDKDNDKHIFTGLYEKMLRIAANNPAQLAEIGKLTDRLGKDLVPEQFLKVYKQFKSAINK